MRHLTLSALAALLIVSTAPAALAAPEPASAAVPRAFASDRSGLFMGRKVAYRAALQETILKDSKGQPAASLFSFASLFVKKQ